MSDNAPALTRRQAMIATAGGVLVGGLATAPTTASAAVAKQGVLRPEVYRFNLGAFEVTVINDGQIQLDGPHPIFGQNATAEEVQALAEANFLPPTRLEIGFTQTIVNTGEKVILFDTGNGAGRRPNAGHMRARLANAGLTPEDIDIVAITHFHGDHIGGMTEDGAAAFPNAEYCIASAEFDFWTNDDLLSDENMAKRHKLVQEKVAGFAPKTQFIAPGAKIASGIEAVDSAGHTPGHMSFHVESEGKRLLVLGDVCNHYVVSLQRPDWHVRFDMDKEKAVAARKAVLGMVAADKIPFVGYHMPFPAVGYLETLGDGFRWVPASYQLNL